MGRLYMDKYICENMGAYIYQPRGGYDIVLFIYINVSADIMKKVIPDTYNSNRMLSTYLCTTHYQKNKFIDQFNFAEVTEKIRASNMIDIINTDFNQLNIHCPALSHVLYTKYYSIALNYFDPNYFNTECENEKNINLFYRWCIPCI